MPEVKNTQNGELQKIQLNILREFDLFCREHNIKYYIIGGSAIGCVRHKGFIPYTVVKSYSGGVTKNVQFTTPFLSIFSPLKVCRTVILPRRDITQS